VTLLHDSTLTEENRRRFERTAERWRQRISFIDVSGHVARIAKNPDKAASFYTQGALFRILIPELLTVPKVIYLDCDVVVNLDIAEFWAVSGQEEARSAFLIAARSPGGGAKYNWLIRCHSKIRGWGLPPVLQDESRLFNSGVLLMNLSRIREEHDLTKEAFDFFERYGRFAAQPDNDFLCAVFSRAGDVFWTEERFNRGGDFYNVGNAIVHAAGAQPWNVFRDTPRDDLFWKTLAESEWGGDLLEMLRKRPIETYRASDGIRLLFARASVYKDRFIALIGMLFYCLCKRRPRA
jgi:lipopolysaccharide biosynthesis glycosyltransferase